MAHLHVAHDISRHNAVWQGTGLFLQGFALSQLPHMIFCMQEAVELEVLLMAPSTLHYVITHKSTCLSHCMIPCPPPHHWLERSGPSGLCATTCIHNDNHFMLLLYPCTLHVTSTSRDGHWYLFLLLEFSIEDPFIESV